MLIAQQPVCYLRLIRTPREIALLDKATNKGTNTNLILAVRPTTALTVDTIELKQ